MEHFYHCSGKELLDLPISRFWSKYENMVIIQLQERIETLADTATASRGDVNRTLMKLNWQLEQLTGVEKVDSLKDIKRRMDEARKAGKKEKKNKGKKDKGK